MLPPDISILTPEERASIPDILQLTPEEIELLDNRTWRLAVALGVNRAMTKLIAENRAAHGFGQLEDANKYPVVCQHPNNYLRAQPSHNSQSQDRSIVGE
jgi:hypothetical protein